MEKFNLFCLPYAGGNRYSYRKFEQISLPFLNIIPLEYPGRGNKMGVPLLTDLDALICDLYHEIKGLADSGSYAVYGHSMGGLAAVLLVRKLIKNNHRAPLHLFVTGTTGPSSSSRNEKKRHLMDRKEFMEEIRNFEGSPEEILQNEELVNYYEPILRADFTASENYVYQEEEPLPIPFTVITGTNEDMNDEDIRLWQKESKCEVDFCRLPGNHFFIFKYANEVLNIISKKLITNFKKVNYE
jgi:surfactin synthase thioesterase subunit